MNDYIITSATRSNTPWSPVGSLREGWEISQLSTFFLSHFLKIPWRSVCWGEAKSRDGKVSPLDLARGFCQFTCKILLFSDKVIGVDFTEAQLSNLVKDFRQKLSQKNSNLSLWFKPNRWIFQLAKSRHFESALRFMVKAFHFINYFEFLTRFQKVGFFGNCDFDRIAERSSQRSDWRILRRLQPILRKQPLFAWKRVKRRRLHKDVYMRKIRAIWRTPRRVGAKIGRLLGHLEG